VIPRKIGAVIPVVREQRVHHEMTAVDDRPVDVEHEHQLVARV
jgi:hypothetical protein